MFSTHLNNYMSRVKGQQAHVVAIGGSANATDDVFSQQTSRQTDTTEQV